MAVGFVFTVCDVNNDGDIICALVSESSYKPCVPCVHGSNTSSYKCPCVPRVPLVPESTYKPCVPCVPESTYKPCVPGVHECTYKPCGPCVLQCVIVRAQCCLC